MRGPALCRGETSFSLAWPARVIGLSQREHISWGPAPAEVPGPVIAQPPTSAALGGIGPVAVHIPPLRGVVLDARVVAGVVEARRLRRPRARLCRNRVEPRVKRCGAEPRAGHLDARKELAQIVVVSA